MSVFGSKAASSVMRLDLPEVLDTAAAPSLADSLRTMRGAPLELNAADVRRFGGLCAQVLLSAAKSWSADGARLTVHNPSPELVESLRLMGLEPNHLTAGE
ncbi:MAG: STAS domain-containing protein [Rubrimonas sp.]